VWSLGFEAADGPHLAVGWGMQVAVSLGGVREEAPCTLESTEAAEEVAGRRMVVGVPHFVTRVPDPAAVDVGTLGPPLRHHPDLAPAGANISWLAEEPDADGAFALRTYERGVEAETLACGTGSAAAAVTAARAGAEPPVVLRTRGGHILRVWFTAQEEEVDDLWLEGPVGLVYRGILGEV
jgi:diaminopimelate epimerase